MKPAELEEWQARILHCAPRLQACVFAAGHREPSVMSKSKLPAVKSASLDKSESSRPLREWWPRWSYDLHTHPHMCASNNDNHLIIYGYLNMRRCQLFPIQWKAPTGVWDYFLQPPRTGWTDSASHQLPFRELLVKQTDKVQSIQAMST